MADAKVKIRSQAAITPYGVIFWRRIGKILRIPARPFRSMAGGIEGMAVLFDQKQRQGVTRLVEMSAPVSIVTPTVHNVPKTPERTKAFLEQCYEKLPFALPAPKARVQISERVRDFSQSLVSEITTEPERVKRRIR